MILRTLEREPSHGYGIARAIERASRHVLVIEEGSLYPALHRLQRRGEIAGEWTTTPQNRRARVYSITPKGRFRLAEQISLWERLSAAVSRVLSSHDDPATPQERPA